MLLSGPQHLKENKIKQNPNNKIKFFSTEKEEIWRKGSFDPFPVMNPRWVLSTRVSYTAPSWVPSAWVFPNIPPHSGDSHTDSTPAPCLQVLPQILCFYRKTSPKRMFKKIKNWNNELLSGFQEQAGWGRKQHR